MHMFIKSILHALAALLIMSLIESPGIVDERSGLLAMTDFSAHRPFVSRALIPILVLLVERVCPSAVLSAMDKVTDGIVRTQGPRIFGNLYQDKMETVAKAGRRVAIFELINWFCLTGFLFVLSLLLNEVCGFSSKTSTILPMTLIFVFPAYLDFANYVYDFAVIFLFSLALLFLYRRNWSGYLIVFTLAVFNKETAVLLIVVFALYHFKQINRAAFYRLLSIQLILFLSHRVGAILIFADNPGQTLEWHLPENLTYLAQVGNYLRFEPLGGSLLFPRGLAIPYPKGLNLPVLVAIGYLIFAGWRRYPLFLKRAALILPILYGTCLFFGIISELRSYYEELPIIFMLAACGGRYLFGIDRSVEKSNR